MRMLKTASKASKNSVFSPRVLRSHIWPLAPTMSPSTPSTMLRFGWLTWACTRSTSAQRSSSCILIMQSPRRPCSPLPMMACRKRRTIVWISDMRVGSSTRAFNRDFKACDSACLMTTDNRTRSTPPTQSPKKLPACKVDSCTSTMKMTPCMSCTMWPKSIAPEAPIDSSKYCNSCDTNDVCDSLWLICGPGSLLALPGDAVSWHGEASRS
mmetsp:Transcript_94176/g.304745  ORF Transcript_94176/g.304745 Transcript_94176/m.304745 type:complete len:211 (+) Transcript_94176:1053-1685(+)